MKRVKILLIGLYLINLSTKAQNTILYTYDGAGNVIQRQLQVLPPCPTCQKLAFQNPKDSNEVAPPVNFKVYPNPAQTFVIIEGELPQNCSEAKVQVTNITGQILKTSIYTGEIKTIPVDDLKSGVYLMEVIYSKSKKSTYKIIIAN